MSIQVYPNVAKAGGFQSQGAEGAAVVNLRQALGNAGSGALRLSRRVNKMPYNRPDPKVYQQNISRRALQIDCLFITHKGILTFGQLF